MKKIALLLLFSMLCPIFASCDAITGMFNSSSDNLQDGSQDTPTGEPNDDPSEDTPAPEPVLRGDSVIIIGKDVCFDLVYNDKDNSRSGRCASDIRTLADELGLKKPKKIADADKSETKCELLIGDTDRALSALAKAEIEEKIEADPRGLHWVWLYSDGQLALYASSRDAYLEAVAELKSTFYTDGEITVKTDLKQIGCIPGPHEAYMSYEIFDNFYSGYTDPFNMKEEDYKKMTVTYETAGRYRISYTDDKGGTFSAAFVQKDWGMWAMGGMTYTTAQGQKHSMTSSSTDYEYVFRVGAKTPTSFRSGNHGNYPGDKNWAYYVDDTSRSNDKLLDMTFYDGKSGEKVEIKLGETKVLDGLRIVLHHNIYEMNYTQANVLINAERSYLYNGYDIMLDTKLYMTQDVNFGNSYSCMLPVDKTYGNCVMFYKEDGSTVYMKTPLSNTVNEIVSGVYSTYIDVWGENNPQYHLIVKLNTPEDQLKNAEGGVNKGYVGLREMLGGGSNKIYCSFNGNYGATEKWGTELHFNNSWSFSLQEDFVNPAREPDFWVGVPKS